MVDDLIKQLLEAGVHFGHQTRRWNPKMKPYIFGQRSGIYIIDLEKTVECLNNAREYIKNVAAQGGRILFIGTKKQAQMIIEQESKRCEMFYIQNRWLGGLLTNFQTVRKSIDKLNKIEKMLEDGSWETLKKKERGKLNKEKEKLLRDLSGIREMAKLPDLIFVVDPKKEEIAVREARKLHIPIVGMLDTNCDPETLDFPIPGNDDALKSIGIVVALIVDSVLEGKKEFLVSGSAKPSQEGKMDQNNAQEIPSPASDAVQ